MTSLKDLRYYVEQFETIYRELRERNDWELWDLALFKVSILDINAALMRQVDYSGIADVAKEEFSDYKKNYLFALKAIDTKLGGRFNRLSANKLLDFCLQSKTRSI